MDMHYNYGRTHPDALRRLIRFGELCCLPGGKTHIGHVETLLAVAEMEGASITDIARKVDRLVMTVSRHIKKLKRPPKGGDGGEGYVIVTPGIDDRVKQVWLTQRGREWITAAIAILPTAQDQWDAWREAHGLDSW